MTITNLLGHLANFGFLYGAYALGKKRMSGWYAQIWANVLYAIQSFVMNNQPLLIVSIILIGVNIYGIYSWTKKEKVPFNLRNHAEHSNFVEVMRHYEGDI